MVMDMGNIQQIGTPTELYNQPKNRFVHSFLGQSNFTETEIRNGCVYIKGGDRPLPVEAPVGKGNDPLLATRPNTIDINHESGFKAKVVKRIFLTDFTEYLVDVGGQVIRVQTPHRNVFRQGDDCFLRFPSPMWYEHDDGAEAEKERARREII